MESIQALELAFANTGRLIAGVRAEQWEAGTPCEKWDVRQLVNHVTSVVQMFGGAAAGEPAPFAPHRHRRARRRSRRDVPGVGRGDARRVAGARLARRRGDAAARSGAGELRDRHQPGRRVRARLGHRDRDRSGSGARCRRRASSRSRSRSSCCRRWAGAIASRKRCRCRRTRPPRTGWSPTWGADRNGPRHGVSWATSPSGSSTSSM